LAKNNFPTKRKNGFVGKKNVFAKFPDHILTASLNQDQLVEEKRTKIKLKKEEH